MEFREHFNGSKIEVFFSFKQEEKSTNSTHIMESPKYSSVKNEFTIDPDTLTILNFKRNLVIF